MDTAFDNYLAELKKCLCDKVCPELDKMPTRKSKEYYALLVAVQLGAGTEDATLSPEAKLRLHHEIAERMAEMI